MKQTNFSKEKIVYITKKVGGYPTTLQFQNFKKVCQKIYDEVGEQNFNAYQSEIAETLHSFLYQRNITVGDCIGVVKHVSNHYYPEHTHYISIESTHGETIEHLGGGIDIGDSVTES